MQRRLQDRVAIVTGAGQGIGAAIARRLAAEGARVVIAELNAETGAATAEALQSEGHTALALQIDVGDQQSVARMVRATVELLGAPDILVNNAGINVFSDPLALSEAEWRRCFNVDLDGVWYCCQAVLPPMLERGAGSIVNIASVHSFQIIPHCFPYPVAKHGLIGLTRALAVEYGARGLRVNAVCPGYIETPLVVQHWSSFPDPEAERQRAASFQPMKRVGQPHEVAAAVAFLASDDASFITGVSLMIDGGGSLVYHD